MAVVLATSIAMIPESATLGRVVLMGSMLLGARHLLI